MSTVEVTILGSGNAFAAGGRFHTCIHVQSGNYQFLLDCGASSIVALAKHGIDLSSLDAIVLSHLHGDHAAGVPFVHMAARVGAKRELSFKIIGPIGTAHVVKSLYKILFPEVDDPKIDFIEYETDKTLQVDQIGITPLKAVHAEATNPHSLRIQFNDKLIAFSGDTEWNDNLIPLSAGADLFICECTSTHSVHRHMSYERLIENKHRITAKHMVITHMDETMLDFNACTFEKAFDGYRYSIH